MYLRTGRLWFSQPRRIVSAKRPTILNTVVFLIKKFYLIYSYGDVESSLYIFNKFFQRKLKKTQFESFFELRLFRIVKVLEKRRRTW